MTDSIVQRIFTDIVRQLQSGELVLPTLPEVALRVRDAAEDEEITTPKLTRLISTDAALAAHLIKVVNSPLLRTRQHIDSLDAAIARMGLSMLRNLVMGLIMKQMFQATSDVTDRRFRALWEHSTLIASISHSLAHLVKLDPEEALLAGLVHDIGALPIIKYAEQEPALLGNAALLDKIIYGLHTAVGAKILRDWNFSSELIAVAEQHEKMDRDGPVDYVDLVIVANIESHIGTDHPSTRQDCSRAFEKLGLEPEISVIEMEGGDDIIALQDALLG